MAYVRVLNKRIPLDNTYENVITFKDLYNANGTLAQSHMTKEAFFKSYDSYYNNTYYYIKTNFKYGDTLFTELRLRTADIGSNVITGLNYVHVKNTENARYPADLYYFITDVLYLSGDIVSLKLELDVYTTYFDYTGFGGDRNINVARCHCDRFKNYNNAFGCPEALFPDQLDSKFEGNLLVNRTKVFSGYNYIIVYLANNTPRLEASSTSVVVGKNALNGSKSAMETKPYYTSIKNLTAPYIVAILPVTSVTLTYSGWSSNIQYGLNADYYYTDDTEGSYYSQLMASTYVLGMQLSTFNFGSYLSVNDNTTFVNPFAKELGTGDQLLRAPLIVIQNLTSIQESTTIENIELYKKVGYGSNFNKSYMQSLTNRDKGLEPKLYTLPYSKFTITSACEKEVEFIPMLSGQKTSYSGFAKTFSPSPISSGEMTFLTSYPYNYYKANYQGSSPTINTEIPLVNDNYQSYITTQKNSFWTGVGMSVANNVVGAGFGMWGSAVGNMGPFDDQKQKMGEIGVLSNMTGGLVGLVGTGLATMSKLKDLKNTPNKLSGNNFDVYSITLNTDIDKYVNTWTLMESELDKVSDYFYQYGYEVDMFRDCSMIGKGIYSYDNSFITRKLFDYVQLNEKITDLLYYDKSGEYPLSKAVRDKFNETFNTGLRLWFITSSSDYRNFKLENKEIN